MNDECDCGWCGRCRDQFIQQRDLEERSDYWDDEPIPNREWEEFQEERDPDRLLK